MPNIRYTFTASGHKAVENAFAGIRKASAKTSAMVTAHAAKTAGVQMAAMNRVKAAARAAETGKTAAATAGASKRATATIQALKRERSMLRGMLAEYTRFEKQKTAVAAAEGRKRIDRERRRRRSRKKSLGRRALGGIGRFGGRVARTGGAFLAMGAGVAVAGGVGAAVRENVRMEDMARDIAIRARMPGGERISSIDVANKARQTAMASPGARGKDVLASTSVFLEKTGDLDAAQRASKVIADIAIATGSNMEDVAGGAASLFQQFKTGKTNMADMREQLALFVIQGKKGAFEMRDMAKGIERMAAAAQVLGVRGDVDQVAAIGALAQFTRRASGGGPRATTSLEGSFQIMMRKKNLIMKRYKGEDGKPFDVGAEAKSDLVSLLPKLFHAMKGDEVKLLNIFSKRSSTAVLHLFKKFKMLEEQTGSTSEAAKLLTDKIKEMAYFEGAAADVEQDRADAQTQTGIKLAAMWEKVVQAFAGGGGIDAIDGLVSAMPQLLATVPALVFAFKYAAIGVAAFIDAVGAFAEGMGADMTDFKKARNDMRMREKVMQRSQNIGEIKGKLLRKDLDPGERAHLERRLETEEWQKADALTMLKDPNQLQKNKEREIRAAIDKVQPAFGGQSKPGDLDQEVKEEIVKGLVGFKGTARAGREGRLVQDTPTMLEGIGGRAGAGGSALAALFGGGDAVLKGQSTINEGTPISDAVTGMMDRMVAASGEQAEKIASDNSVPASLQGLSAKIDAVMFNTGNIFGLP